MTIGHICFLLYASEEKWFVVQRALVRNTFRSGLRCSFFMAEQDWNTNEKNAGGSHRTTKKPYQEPAFRHERVFETMALTCGKIDPTQFSCRFNRHTS
jgi:hypothetical protein